MKKLISIIFVMIVVTSCRPEGSKGTPFTFNRPGGAPVTPTAPSSMTLLNPSSSPGYIATPSVSIVGVVVDETIKIYRNSNCTTLVGSGKATSSTLNLTLGTLPVGVHSFYAIATNSFTTTACSGALLTYNYLGVAPQNATSIALQSPATSPSTDSTPTIILSGVRSGETSRVFIDSLCSIEYGSAVSSGTSVTITTIGLAPGTHQFYVNSSNAAGTSTCSSALFTYQYTGVIPTPASALSLTNPDTSPNYDSTPTVTLTGVANGDTVNLYTDSGCSILVASGVSDHTSSVVLTTSTLSVGSYTFYSDSSNVIGTSSCSGALGAYAYSGPSPTVAVSWSANRERAVNSAGGGYRVYYSRVSGFDISTAPYVDVAYVSGPTTAITYNFTTLMAGITYFKVQAYSAMNAPGLTSGSQSAASAQFSVNIP